MKLTLNEIFPRQTKATFLLLPAVVLLSGMVPSVGAQELPNQSSNYLYYPTNSQRFFEEGKSKFGQEIQNLIEKQPSSPDSLLQIDENLLKQRKLLPRCARDFRLKLLDKTCQYQGKS
jgi:hypothetical protein